MPSVEKHQWPGHRAARNQGQTRIQAVEGLRFGCGPSNIPCTTCCALIYVAEQRPGTPIRISRSVSCHADGPPTSSAGTWDGYFPDAVQTTAVWEKVGFIHLLTRIIWEGHLLRLCLQQRFARRIRTPRRPVSRHRRRAPSLPSGRNRKKLPPASRAQLPLKPAVGVMNRCSPGALPRPWANIQSYERQAAAIDSTLPLHSMRYGYLPAQALGYIEARETQADRRAGLPGDRCRQGHAGIGLRRAGLHLPNYTIKGKNVDYRQT